MLHSVDSAQQSPKSLAETTGFRVIKPDEQKIAVLLNRNARQVTDVIVKRVERIVGRDHVYYSSSLEEAEAFAREIVQKGYGTIVSGGGDGTLCQAINMIHRYISESNRWRAERSERFGEEQTLIGTPRFAFLRLGTGNGIGSVVGASNALRDLKNLVDYLPGRTHELPLVEVEGEKCFFAGIGFDSLMLNDYNQLKEKTSNRFLKPILHSVIGYLVTLFTRTLPKALMGQANLKVRITSRGRASYIDPRRGDAVIEVEPGTTLYEGSAMFVGVGSSPFYGAGFKIFPFASMMPGMMQLRIGRLNPLIGVLNMVGLWRGYYRNPGMIIDYLVEDIHVELAEPFPFQHSGEALGLRQNINFKVADEGLKLVDFLPPRVTG
jgi:diacylglycerol kinase family enzyme